jgi:hypothetical protein
MSTHLGCADRRLRTNIKEDKNCEDAGCTITTPEAASVVVRNKEVALRVLKDSNLFVKSSQPSVTNTAGKALAETRSSKQNLGLSK